MIRKSGNRFSERSCSNKKMDDEHDSTQLNHALAGTTGLFAEKWRRRNAPPGRQASLSLAVELYWALHFALTGKRRQEQNPERWLPAEPVISGARRSALKPSSETVIKVLRQPCKLRHRDVRGQDETDRGDGG